MISVLLPSRGRAAELMASIDNILGTADDPGQVEILIAADSDDAETLALPSAWDYKPERVSMWCAPERFGYARLHEYFNFLAGEATGDWLMMWNDDAEMITRGWDSVIAGHEPERCLFMDALYPSMGARGNVFPVWPARWYSVLGYVSMSPNNDVWISEIASRLGREIRVPIRARHLRRHDDDQDVTHAEGRAVMGEGNDPEYDSYANRLERSRAVRVLRGLY